MESVQGENSYRSVEILLRVYLMEAQEENIRGGVYPLIEQLSVLHGGMRTPAAVDFLDIRKKIKQLEHEYERRIHCTSS